MTCKTCKNKDGVHNPFDVCGMCHDMSNYECACDTCRKAWTDDCERSECWEHEYCKYEKESEEEK